MSLLSETQTGHFEAAGYLEALLSAIKNVEIFQFDQLIVFS